MVRAKMFARFREVLGDEIAFEDGITVADLKSSVADMLRSRGENPGIILVAVNGRYASDDMVISSDDEVAVFPPVSGG